MRELNLAGSVLKHRGKQQNKSWELTVILFWRITHNLCKHTEKSLSIRQILVKNDHFPTLYVEHNRYTYIQKTSNFVSFNLCPRRPFFLRNCPCYGQKRSRPKSTNPSKNRDLWDFIQQKVQICFLLQCLFIKGVQRYPLRIFKY